MNSLLTTKRYRMYGVLKRIYKERRGKRLQLLEVLQELPPPKSSWFPSLLPASPLQSFFLPSKIQQMIQRRCYKVKHCLPLDEEMLRHYLTNTIVPLPPLQQREAVQSHLHVESGKKLPPSSTTILRTSNKQMFFRL